VDISWLVIALLGSLNVVLFVLASIGLRGVPRGFSEGWVGVCGIAVLLISVSRLAQAPAWISSLCALAALAIIMGFAWKRYT
jgi:hypothetical protein